MSEKVTYRLTLSYDGAYFQGWHTQKEAPTVQGVLNQIVSELYKEKIFVWGAGRTDSGAHALKYTAHFRTRSNCLPREKIKLILNSKLPHSIRILDVSEESPKFHATFTCTARTYLYVVYLGEVLSPHMSTRAYHQFLPIDFDLLKQCIKKFQGIMDFKEFCYGYSATERQKKTTIRRLDYFRVKKKGDYLLFFIKGEGFLRGMIRTLIGTCLSVAQGSMSMADLDATISGNQPLPQGKWAPVPAKGLYFKRAHFNR